eukprot:m.166722 g.166722  ORF g.166722 m.166722 type:complete len:78 (+) comp13456_c0_seq5:2370-2603(+)
MLIKSLILNPWNSSTTFQMTLRRNSNNEQNLQVSTRASSPEKRNKKSNHLQKHGSYYYSSNVTIATFASKLPCSSEQ